MADKNLILGARLAAGGFNTGLADVVDKSIARATKNITGIFEAQAEYAAEVDRRAFAILDKFPPEINFAKLPPAERKALQTWATTKKEQYFKKAQELAKMKVNSPDFLTTQNELNTIKQAYINANDNLLKGQAFRTTYSTDRSGEGKSPLSKSMHDENIGFVELDEVFLPESPTGAGYSVAYDDFGNPTFTVGNKSFTLDEINLNYRDKKALTIFDALSKNVQTLGARGRQFIEKTAEYNEAVTNIDLALESNNSIKSILNDNVFSFLNLTPEEIAGYKQDLPKARQELKSKLLFHLGELNKNTYAGYTAKLNAQNNTNFTPGYAEKLDGYVGTSMAAMNFVNKNPNAEEVRALFVSNDPENANKFYTGAGLKQQLKNRSKTDLADAFGSDYKEEIDNFVDNQLYFWDEGSPVPLNYTQEQLYDTYLKLQGVPPLVAEKFKQDITFNSTAPSPSSSPPSLLSNPLDLTDDQSQKLDAYINEMGASLKNVNRTGTPRTDEELITEF